MKFDENENLETNNLRCYDNMIYNLTLWYNKRFDRKNHILIKLAPGEN